MAQCLDRNNVYRLPVVIPPLPVLAAFDDLAANLRSKIFANETQAQILATLRDTLLPPSDLRPTAPAGSRSTHGLTTRTI
jgi:hypothetical protein